MTTVSTVADACAAAISALDGLSGSVTRTVEALADAASKHGRHGFMDAHRALNACCGRAFEITRAATSFTHELLGCQRALDRLPDTVSGDEIDRELSAVGASLTTLSACLPRLDEVLDDLEAVLATVRSKDRDLDAATTALADLRTQLAATTATIRRAAGHRDDLDGALHT